MTPKLKEKINESLTAVLPVTAVMLLLCITITPMPLSLFIMFIVGAVFLIVGMGLFSLGADMAMMPIGERIGWQLTKFKSFTFIAVLCFFIGAMVTIAEPDLQVLAEQLKSVPNKVLIFSVAAGVGVFLAVAFARSLLGLDLAKILLVVYPLIMILSIFVPEDFVPVAFDSGGVTTGPITVPFIMAIGIGLGAARKKRDDSGTNNFGLIALCSIGPILAVMILGIVYNPESATYTSVVIPELTDTRSVWQSFMTELPHYAREVLFALAPIAGFFVVFQILFIKLRQRHLIKILIGLVYTFLGLTLFLTGVNVGFMPVGSYLGAQLVQLSNPWIIVPVAMVIGLFIVKAEPAVVVLNKQVEDITGGAIPQYVMMTGLSIGMAISLGLALTRVITGIPLMYFLVPGYAFALILSFFVPPLFTAIAFDSGGVASGPMTATFLLPFAIGASEAIGGNVLTDAFGIVAMVAMTPLVIIQLIGLAYRIKTGSKHLTHEQVEAEGEIVIINFYEEAAAND